MQVKSVALTKIIMFLKRMDMLRYQFMGQLAGIAEFIVCIFAEG